MRLSNQKSPCCLITLGVFMFKFPTARAVLLSPACRFFSKRALTGETAPDYIRLINGAAAEQRRDAVSLKLLIDLRCQASGESQKGGISRSF